MTDAPDAPDVEAASEAARVAEVIRERIFEGALAPGQRLVQQALAEELGVSRLPIRTALGALALEGLVETRERRGTIVRVFTARDLADLVEVQECLDLLAIRLAAERATPEDIGGMREVAARAAAADDAAAARDLLQEMRALVVGAARNQVLAQASAVIDQRVRHLLALISDAGTLAETTGLIASGVGSRDGSVAEQLLGTAMLSSRREHRVRLMSSLGTHDPFDDEDIDADPVEPMGAASAAFHREQLRLGVETERVLSALRGQILDRTRPPGSRLSERALAEELGAGRIPTRRAIETLIGEGLAVPGGPRSAARVHQPTTDDVVDMLQVSERLSSLMLRIASQRIGRVDLRRLLGIVREIEAFAEAGDAQGTQEAMERFRIHLLDVAENDALTAVDLVVRWRLRSYLTTMQDLDRGARFCRVLYDALAFRDPDGAEESIRVVYGYAIDFRRAGGHRSS
ncbi:GntR family transcriptional regulator [Microbacterium tumbae]